MNFGLQYGAECWRAVGRRSRLVTRAAFEYQYFEQSDDYSMASSFAFLTNDFDFGAATGAIAENSGKDLNMFGFTLMIGINYEHFGDQATPLKMTTNQRVAIAMHHVVLTAITYPPGNSEVAFHLE